MNKGALRGIGPANRKGKSLGGNTVGTGISTRKRPNRRPLLFVPTMPFDIVALGSYTADSAVLLSPTMGGQPVVGVSNRHETAYVPADGSVVALEMFVIARADAVGISEIYVYDYDDDYNITGVSTFTGGGGLHAYSGKVAGHWAAGSGMVYTGGKDGTQFKYQLGWTAGTAEYYIRGRGYYIEAE